jgi:hypothetical protein
MICPIRCNHTIQYNTIQYDEFENIKSYRKKEEPMTTITLKSSLQKHERDF